MSPLYTFERLLTADTHADIAEFMERHAGELGYGSFFYSPLLQSDGVRQFFEPDTFPAEPPVVAPEQLHTKSIVTTFPASWIRRYQEAGHVATDPVIQRLATSNLPILWDRFDSDTRRHRVFDEARQHGLATGITVPITGVNGARALFSVASDEDPVRSPAHTDAMAGLVVLTAIHLHEAMSRIVPPSPKACRPTLTPREAECLTWAAAGKTSWEIAHILSVSERTAIFHIGNATRKLGASNRRQAVARAISLRLIRP